MRTFLTAVQPARLRVDNFERRASCVRLHNYVPSFAWCTRKYALTRVQEQNIIVTGISGAPQLGLVKKVLRASLHLTLPLLTYDGGVSLLLRLSSLINILSSGVPEDFSTFQVEVTTVTMLVSTKSALTNASYANRNPKFFLQHLRWMSAIGEKICDRMSVQNRLDGIVMLVNVVHFFLSKVLRCSGLRTTSMKLLL